MLKYYIDTAIWIDLYEDRFGFNNETLGEYALKLFSLIIESDNKIIISDMRIIEFKTKYSDD